MNLDNLQEIQEIDKESMQAEIDGLPEQLENAWLSGLRQPLPAIAKPTQVLIAGMGGSAIGADLVAGYVEPDCGVPVFVLRDYTLPAWAKGLNTLVITSSHSGNTEETLSVYDQAVAANCQIIAITRGGKLGERARENGHPVWTFQHDGQPRSAVGFSFGLLLALFFRLGLVPDQSQNMATALQAMRAQKSSLQVDSPVHQNPAKRLAGQLVGRWVAVIGSGVLAPVARRWKGQLSEVAKAWAQFEFLPEADHNTLAGTQNPEEVLSKTTVVFLRSPSDHPRNRLRSELTMRGFMLAGMGTDFYEAKGDNRLAHLWTTLHFGDYVSYYLALSYEVDPTPIPAIQDLKAAMS